MMLIIISPQSRDAMIRLFRRNTVDFYQPLKKSTQKSSYREPWSRSIASLRDNTQSTVEYTRTTGVIRMRRCAPFPLRIPRGLTTAPATDTQSAINFSTWDDTAYRNKLNSSFCKTRRDPESTLSLLFSHRCEEEIYQIMILSMLRTDFASSVFANEDIQ